MVPDSDCIGSDYIGSDYIVSELNVAVFVGLGQRRPSHETDFWLACEFRAA